MPLYPFEELQPASSATTRQLPAASASGRQAACGDSAARSLLASGSARLRRPVHGARRRGRGSGGSSDISAAGTATDAGRRGRRCSSDPLAPARTRAGRPGRPGCAWWCRRRSPRCRPRAARRPAPPPARHARATRSEVIDASLLTFAASRLRLLPMKVLIWSERGGELAQRSGQFLPITGQERGHLGELLLGLLDLAVVLLEHRGELLQVGDRGEEVSGRAAQGLGQPAELGEHLPQVRAVAGRGSPRRS